MILRVSLPSPYNIPYLCFSTITAHRVCFTSLHLVCPETIRHCSGTRIRHFDHNPFIFLDVIYIDRPLVFPCFFASTAPSFDFGDIVSEELLIFCGVTWEWPPSCTIAFSSSKNPFGEMMHTWTDLVKASLRLQCTSPACQLPEKYLNLVYRCHLFMKTLPPAIPAFQSRWVLAAYKSTEYSFLVYSARELFYSSGRKRTPCCFLLAGGSFEMNPNYIRKNALCSSPSFFRWATSSPNLLGEPSPHPTY